MSFSLIYEPESNAYYSRRVVRLSNSQMTLSRLIIRSTTCLENLNAIPVRGPDQIKSV